MLHYFTCIYFLLFAASAHVHTENSQLKETSNTATIVENSAVNAEPVIKEVQYPSIKTVELCLQNGMKVILKPTNFERNEVYYRLVASGGYSTLPSSQYAAGKLATESGMESGIGDLTADQLSTHLYEHSIEFIPQILPFSRSIEGSVVKSEIESLFELINKFFTKHKLSQEAFNIVLSQEKTKILKHSVSSPEVTIEEAMCSLNTPHLTIAKTLTISDLENAQYTTAVQLFDDAFSNPADFILIIIGDFEVEKVKHDLIKWLGIINVSKQNEKFVSLQSFIQPFPKGITPTLAAARAALTTLMPGSIRKTSGPRQKIGINPSLQPFGLLSCEDRGALDGHTACQ